MTAEQLRHYINQLAASGREQSQTGNFGVGAKVAAGSRNPHGLEYRSWHQGDGSLVCFKRHPDGRWGLEPQRWADGRVDFWRPLGEAEKPWLLRGRGSRHPGRAARPARAARHHAGAAERHRAPTALDHALPQRPLPPLSRAGRGARARTARPRRRTALRRIHGEQHHLEQHAVAAGTVELGDAIAAGGCSTTTTAPGAARRVCGRRPVTPPPCSTTSSTTCWRRPAAGTDACRTSASASATSASSCTSSPRPRPVAFSATPRGRCCCSTTSRCRGRAGARSSPPPCRRDPASSRNAPPAPTASRAERRSAAASARSCRSTDSAATAQPGRRSHSPPSRYRPRRATSPPADPRPGAQHPAPSRLASARTSGSRAARRDLAATGRQRTTPTTTCRPSDRRSARRRVDLSARRTRAPGDLEDQAARYHPGRHELTINADFRAITDLIAHWRARYRGVPGARRDDRGAGPGVVRADPGRGRARRPQLALERGAARRAPVAELVHRRPAATTTAARHAQKRLGQRLGAPRSEHAESTADPTAADPCSRQVTPARKCAAAAARVGEQTA